MTAPVNNKASYTFARTMQRLWTDHAVWMRQYIVAAVDERPEAPEAAARLLRSTDDVGHALEDYYGKRASRRIAKLLRQQVMLCVDLVDAARFIEKTKFHDIDAVWASNGQDFVDELCGRNTAWSREQMLARWELVRTLIKDEITARLEENFDGDADTFDQLLTATLTFADELTDGILRQFADKFAA